MKKSKFLLMLTLLSLGVSQPAYAYSDKNNSIEDVSNLSWDSNDPLSWNQNNASDMPKSWLGNQMLDGSSGGTFPENADLIFVYTFLAIKTHRKDIGYIPSYANAELESYHAYANGQAHLGAEGIWSNGWHAELTDEGSQLQKEVSLDDAKKAWNSGKLVVLQVKYPEFTEENPYTHFLAIDSVESDGDVYIFDSVNPSSKFSDAYSTYDIVGMITLSSDNAKSYDLPKLWQKRGATDIYSSNGEAKVGANGGGGALLPSSATEEATLPSENSKNQSLGTYTTRDDAPEKLERGNKVEDKKEKGSSNLVLAGGILATVLIGGTILGVWILKRKQNTISL